MECNVSIQKITRKDFAQICRICFSFTNLTNLDSNIRKLLRSISGDEFKADDELPNQICDLCIVKLKEFSDFKTTIKHNDSYLRLILNEYKTNFDSNESLNIKDCIQHSPFETSDSDNIDIKQNPTEVVCDKIEASNKNITNRSFQCTECDRNFTNRSTYNIHLRIHTKESPHECKICQKKFRYAPNLKRHENIVHKGLKPFKCEFCFKEFATLLNKTEHERIHTGERPYNCNQCGLSFKKYSTFYEHDKRHKIKNGQLPKKETSIKKYPKKVSDPKQLECEICKKVYSSKQALFVHKKIHSGEKIFLCTECGKSFLRYNHLEVHFRIHTGEKPYKCTDCGKQFRQIAVYRNHLLIHSNKRAFKCKICEKSFIQLGHLQNHLKTHTGEKPYKCTFCNKSFTQNGNLRAHTRIHTNERPFKCMECFVSFYDSSSLKKHKKLHNVNEVATT